MKIKKNDIVKIISGNFRGKIGKVTQVFPKEDKVQIENIGFFKKHIKPRVYRKYSDGGIIKFQRKINISNILFYSKKFNRSFRIGFNVDSKGIKHRIFKGKNAPEESFI